MEIKDMIRSTEAALANESPEDKDHKEFLITGIKERLENMRDGITKKFPDQILLVRNHNLFDVEYGEIDVQNLLTRPEEELDEAREKAFKEIMEDIETWYEEMPLKGVLALSNSLENTGHF